MMNVLRYQTPNTIKICEEAVRQFKIDRQIFKKQIIVLPLCSGYEYEGKRFARFIDLDFYWFLRRYNDQKKIQMGATWE